MNVNKVPLSSWQCVFTVGKWCSRCVWLLRVADGQHRGSGVPVTVGAALRLGSSSWPFSSCWYEGKSVGAATGTGKCFPVNGLVPQCHVTEGHECSLPWNRDYSERTMSPLKAQGWDRALGGGSACPALPGLLWQRAPHPCC